MSMAVERDEASGRYVVTVAGGVAGFVAFRREPDALVLTHTEVDDGLEGQGVGSALLRGALDDIRSRGELVVPLCPFVRAFLDRHDEYADLVHGRRPPDAAPA